MTEPIYDESTEQLYDRLPQCFRDEDPETDYTTKKFVYAVGTQIDSVAQKIERFSYVPPEDGAGYRTSDLADPATADAAWLPWLAQLVAVQLDTAIPVPDQRAAIQDSILGIKVGSKAAIEQAARSSLVGTKTVKVFDHSDETSIGTETEWDLLIVTADSETLENSLPVDQSTFSSTNGWLSDSWFANLIGNTAWTTTGMTASTGSTEPLLTNYDTFSGSGNTYTPAAAIANVKYTGMVRLRCLDGLATTANLVLEFMNGGSSLATTTVPITGITATWVKAVVSAVAPASTTHVRLKLVRSAAGILHVTTKMITTGGEIPFFNSTFAGVTTDDSIYISPIINYWRNASYDVSGGMLTNDGLLTSTTARFVYGSSAGFFLVQGTTDPYVAPDYDVPTFNGEAVITQVKVLGYQDGCRARLEIRTTLSDATTVADLGSWVDIVDEDFVTLSMEHVSPSKAKTAKIYLHFEAAVGDRFYIDGGMTVRTSNTLGYFDGNKVGNTWTDANHANAVTTHDTPLPINIVTETFIPDSNALRLPAIADGVTLRARMNPARAAVTVVATDPWTFMLSAYANQDGNYQAHIRVIFYNAGLTEVSRLDAAYQMSTADTVVDMMLQGVVPATATSARMSAYIYGGQEGDSFGITMAGARIGSAPGWIAVTADPVAAVIAAGAKPAGVILHSQTFSGTWAAIEAALPTWADWDGKSWAQIEEIGL
jgi:hypothetical protein